MRIVIDQDLDNRGNVIASHVLHTDLSPFNVIPNPDVAGQTITNFQYLVWLQNNKAKHPAHGYDVRSVLPGEAAPKSRWQRIVEACNAPAAPADHRALNLTL